MSRLVEPRHIGDGLYFLDEGYTVEIAVNYHTNVVAYLDIHDLDKVIEYLQEVKKRLEP